MQRKKVLVMGVIGADVHAVGNRILYQAFTEAGFDVINLGVMVSQEEYIAAAIEAKADAIVVSSLYGQGELDLSLIHISSACRAAMQSCASAPMQKAVLNQGSRLRALVSSSGRSMSWCAPQVLRSTRPGFGVKFASSKRAPTAQAATSSAAAEARRWLVCHCNACNPWALLRAQTDAAFSHKRHLRGDFLDIFSPLGVITSKSNSRPSGPAVSNSTHRFFRGSEF